MTSPFLDHFVTPLNACSAEVAPHPFKLPLKDDDDEEEELGEEEQEGDDSLSSLFWPVVFGCYELDDKNNDNNDNNSDNDQKQSRGGCLLLYLLDANKPKTFDVSTTTTTTAAATEAVATHKVTGISGVLDGKWRPTTKTSFDGSNYGNNNNGSPSLYYATAQSSGSVDVYKLDCSTAETTTTTCGQEHNIALCPLGSTTATTSSNTNNDDNSDNDSDNDNGFSSEETKQDALCLSLNWNSTGDQIVSSYSNGSLALHDIPSMKIIRLWENAHSHQMGMGMSMSMSMSSMKSSIIPAEVWTAAFVGVNCDNDSSSSSSNDNNNNNNNSNLIASGGEDACVKLWDARVDSSVGISRSTKPQQCWKGHWEAGVTSIAASPHDHNLVACGSYDESLHIFDLRSPQLPMLSTTSSGGGSGGAGGVGGGVWRIRWHPSNSQRLLVAVMHGGCRVVDLHCSNNNVTADASATTGDGSIEIVQEFTQHKSMAYGADWVIGNDYDAAVSCSFYDRSAFLWKVD